MIVNPVVKMRPHPAAHAHYPITRKFAGLSWKGMEMRDQDSPFQSLQE